MLKSQAFASVFFPVFEPVERVYVCLCARNDDIFVRALVKDLFFLVSELLEPLEGLIEVLGGEVKAKLSEPGLEGVAARVLAEHERRARNADRLGLHYFVGGFVLEQSVLVYAGLVREGVVADYGLVGLDHYAGYAAYEAARGVYLLGHDVGLEAEDVLPGLKYHDDLFE